MEIAALARMNVDDDRALASRIVAGDEAAFAALFHGLRNEVYRTTRAITRCPEAGLDAVQETFLKVHRHIGTWNGRSTLRTWFGRIALRTAIDLTRRSRRRQETAAECDPAHDPRAALDRSLLLARLECLAGRLRGRQALVLKLRLFGGWSNREIAELVGISEANVRVQLSKATRSLKEML